MNINPSSPQGANTPDPTRLESQRARESAAPPPADRPLHDKETKSGAARSDRLEVSQDAQVLADGVSGAVNRSGLSAERLKQISARLANGHYDRPEVMAQVAQQILQDPQFKAGGTGA
jgi:hypothetical protein